MPTENERRIQDFATGSKALLDEWTARMGGVAQRLDTDTLTVDDIVKTWAAGTRLAIQGWGLAYSMLGSPPPADAPASDPAVEQVVSQWIETPAAARVNAPIMLSFSGPLAATVGDDQIPVAEIQLLPSQLGPTETKFRFQFTKGSRATVEYRGTVEFRTAANPAPVATLGVSVEVQ